MITKEIINGKEVIIEWTFDEVNDHINTGWADWLVEGDGKDGKKYTGNCQADTENPEDLHDVEVTNIEEIEYDLPANWEPDFGARSIYEERDAMIAAQKLK